MRLPSASNIVIRTPNWVGDAVMSTPFIRAARKNFPHAKITLLAKPWVSPVYEENPYIDRILIYDASGRHGGAWGKVRLAGELRRERFDMALLLQNAFEAALITWMAGIPCRVGFDTDARRMLLTHPVHRCKSFKKLHQIGYYLEILSGAGLVTDGVAPELFFTESERRQAKEVVRDNDCPEDACVIGVNPGAAFGTAKRWFVERYADVCVRLKSVRPVFFLVFGSPAETALGETICEAVGDGCLNLCGRTSLRQAMSLIGCCDLFMTNDSGLMHVAAAQDIPQIAVFGSTNHTTTYPESRFSHIVRSPVPCSPCMKPDCPSDHRCMDAVSVDRVLNLAITLLDSGKRP